MGQFELYINNVKNNPTNTNLYKLDYIKNKFPDFYNNFIASYNNLSDKSITYKEYIYMILHNLQTPEYCKICGKRKKFYNFSKGYKDCCKESEEDPYKILIGSTNANIFKESYIKHNFPSFYNEILIEYDLKYTWRERLYMKLHNMKEPYKCDICGNYTKFINFTTGYLKHCSYKCSNVDPVSNKKREQTNLIKYGCKCVLSNKDIQNQIKLTNIEKYGVEYHMQNKEKANNVFNIIKELYGGIGNASKYIFEKQKSTMINRYGVENASQLEYNKEKLRLNCPLIFKENKEKAQFAKKSRIINEYSDVVGFTDVCDFKDETGWICSCPHPECNKCKEKTYITFSQLYRDRKRDNTELCTKLLPYNASNNKNTTIELFVQNILNELNIEYITGDHSVLGSKELDIFIPSKNIAIECNGIYWHSAKYKNTSYHINKFKDCKIKNIQLLSIWEDWVRNKPEIVKSLIRSKLGIYDVRIGARKCNVKIIKNDKANKFLNENHIQGSSRGGKNIVMYGLYYNDELVSVMSFGLKKNIWELKRFCSKLNWQIIGGAEKLLKNFIKDYNPDKIVSSSSNDISWGNLYKKLGFYSDNIIKGSYWYIDNSFKRYHRTSFSKIEIVKRGWRDNVNNTWTEWGVMDEHYHEYSRIHDSGTITWIWTNFPSI